MAPTNESASLWVFHVILYPKMSPNPKKSKYHHYNIPGCLPHRETRVPDTSQALNMEMYRIKGGTIEKPMSKKLRDRPCKIDSCVAELMRCRLVYSSPSVGPSQFFTPFLIPPRVSRYIKNDKGCPYILLISQFSYDA